MKALLIAINAKYIHSNLAVYSLKSYCEEKGHIEGIELFETTINNRLEDILNEIYERRPDIAAFSCYIWNIEYVYRLIPELRKLLPGIHIWLGGPEVSYSPDKVLKKLPQAELVMCGEGEETFLSLCRIYNLWQDSKKEEEFKEALSQDIEGIAYRRGNREFIKTGDRKPADLSSIPFPYKDIDNLENRIIYYESSRGCPFSCSYCLSSVEKQIRFRDIELVKEELQFFLDKKVPLVKFVDRTFNCKKSHAMAIWQYIYDHDNGVTRFHFEVGADLMTDDEIELISKMRPGLIQLEIGIQSVNSDTIREIRRTMNLSKAKEAVERIREKGNIHQHLDLIAGLPYEDYGSFIKSFNQVYNMKPNQLQLGFLKVIAGSYMANNTERYGMAYKEFPPYEVLYTKWLSYDEILKLKLVEEAVEIYYNSGQFKYTVKFLENYFYEPFKMYYEIGKYYKDRFPSNIKHSRIDRYNILNNYFQEKEKSPERIKLFRELMTYDIYLRENIHTRPPFAVSMDKYREEIRVIAREMELTRSEHIEPASDDIIKFLEENGGLSSVKRVSSERIKGRYFVFDYKNRNPLTGDGSCLMYCCVPEGGNKNA